MVNFEMPLKNGGYISYDEKSNMVIIQDQDYDVVEVGADELIKFTNSNAWKYLSKKLMEK